MNLCEKKERSIQVCLCGFSGSYLFIFHFLFVWNCGACSLIHTYIGEAITTRNSAIERFVGLGPPDLVVLEKAYSPPKMLPGIIKHAKYSYYHWVCTSII